MFAEIPALNGGASCRLLQLGAVRIISAGSFRGVTMAVVSFRSAEQRSDVALAAEIIEAFGITAELEVRRLAVAMAPRPRARLDRIADEIVRKQGFGWYF